jgi:hypothetical protein
MPFVVVTVTDGKRLVRDLELPSDVRVGELAPSVARAVHHPDLPEGDVPVKVVIKSRTSGEVIGPDRTLEGAGVVDGDTLLLMVKALPAHVAESQTALRFAGPGFMAAGGASFPLRRSSNLIGRVDRASGVTAIVLGVDLSDLDVPGDPSVSRRHAKVLYKDGRYLLEDLNSTNSTYVNDHELAPGQRVALNHGDQVRFGEVTLTFVWDSQEATGRT